MKDKEKIVSLEEVEKARKDKQNLKDNARYDILIALKSIESICYELDGVFRYLEESGAVEDMSKLRSQRKIGRMGSAITDVIGSDDAWRLSRLFSVSADSLKSMSELLESVSQEPGARVASELLEDTEADGAAYRVTYPLIVERTQREVIDAMIDGQGITEELRDLLVTDEEDQRKICGGLYRALIRRAEQDGSGEVER